MELPVKVIKSKRKTISLELRLDGLTVRVPQRMKKQEIESFLLKKKDWIEKHYSVMQEREKNAETMAPYTEKELKALAEKALRMIPQKVKYYAELMGVSYGRITIRSQRTRWGSCSDKGNLNFNCLLMEFPDEIIDSVVVHELCHRIHMNHSKEFYAEVEKVFPEYKRCRKWLKENGSRYLRRL